MATNTSEKYKELHELRESLYQRTEQLRKELHRLEDGLVAVDTTLKYLQEGVEESKTVGEVAKEMDEQWKARIKEFAGLTQIQALVKFARENPDRRFRLTEARDLLEGVGLIKSKKNASNIIWNAIQRSERFKRVAPGEYQLIDKPVSVPPAPVGVIKERLRSSG